MTLPAVRVPYPHIEIHPEVLGGSPTIGGTRIPVRRIWSWYSRGVSVEVLIRRYPSIGPAKLLSALAFSFDNRELIDADLAQEQALFPIANADMRTIPLFSPRDQR